MTRQQNIPKQIRVELISLGSHLQVKFKRLVILSRLKSKIKDKLYLEIILRMDNVETTLECILDYKRRRYCPQQFEVLKHRIITSSDALNKLAIKLRKPSHDHKD